MLGTLMCLVAVRSTFSISHFTIFLCRPMVVSLLPFPYKFSEATFFPESFLPPRCIVRCDSSDLLFRQYVPEMKSVLFLSLSICFAFVESRWRNDRGSK